MTFEAESAHCLAGFPAPTSIVMRYFAVLICCAALAVSACQKKPNSEAKSDPASPQAAKASQSDQPSSAKLATPSKRPTVPPTVPQIDPSASLTKLIEGTASIEVVPGRTGAAAASGQRFTISDAADVKAFIAALGDQPATGEVPRCPVSYLLRFLDANGKQIAGVGAICGDKPTMLRSRNARFAIANPDTIHQFLAKAMQ